MKNSRTVEARRNFASLFLVLLAFTSTACERCDQRPRSTGENHSRDLNDSREASFPERIDRRLLDELESAEITLGPTIVPPDTAPVTLLSLASDADIPRWVRLFESTQELEILTRDGEIIFNESLCAIVDVAAEEHYALHANPRIVEDLGNDLPPEAGGVRLKGTVFAVELDSRPDGSAQGCRPEYLVRHGIELRADRRQIRRQAQGSQRADVDLSFSTTAQTRAVAVIVASELSLFLGQNRRLMRGQATSIALSRVSFHDSGSGGLDLERLRERFPADPLLVPSKQGLRFKPDLDRRLRDALVAPPGSRICWSVQPVEGAALHIGYGVAWLESTLPGEPVEFKVSLDGRTLHRESLDPSQRGWRDHRIELLAREPGQPRVSRVSANRMASPMSEQPLCLETSSSSDVGVTWSFWASPELTVPEPSRPAGRPATVILVSVDTLRADRLGTYGYELPTSPVLDELARESLVFDHHVAATGWTLPSHISMFTGLSPEAHGMTAQFARALELFSGGFDPTLPTLAASLREAGYSTHGIAAGPYVHPSFGFHRGFDSFDHSSISSLEHTHDDVTAPRVTDLARDILDRAKGRPTFIFVHHWDVHYDYIPPVEDLEVVHPQVAALPSEERRILFPYTGRPIDAAYVRLAFAARPVDGSREAARRVVKLLPRFPRAQGLVRLMSDLYDGEVHSVDRHLGLLFEHLRRIDRWDDSVIVITGDHGEAFLEHGTLGHATEAVHREGVDVPLIIRAPGRIEPGRRRGPTATVDISATLLDLLGLPPLSGAQGKSLLEDHYDPERLVVAHDGAYYRVVATRDDYRLVTWRRFGGDELFDVSADPEERRDLSESQEDERDELRFEVARHLLQGARGVHAAVVGSSDSRPWTITFEAEGSLGTVLTFGPPGTARLIQEPGATRASLRAQPGPGELVAMTIMVSDRETLRCTVTRGDGAPGADTVVVGADTSLASSEVDESWWLETDRLPEGLGLRPDMVYLWRTHAGSTRIPLPLPQETIEQLRALGYIQD